MLTHIAPYHVSNRIINTLAEICEELVKYHPLNSLPQMCALAIEGAFKLEGDRLTSSQITDIMDGNELDASQQQVRTVRNILLACERMPHLDIESASDFMALHDTLCSGETICANRVRATGHSGATKRHDRPHHAINILFSSIGSGDFHPLIKGCLLHYYINYISPFEQGTLITARIWHMLILCRWKSLFQYIPFEYHLAQESERYYRLITQKDSPNDCTEFIEFMLTVLLKAINTQGYVQLSTQEKIVKLIQYDTNVTREQLAEYLNISPDGVKYHLKRLTQAGVLRRNGSTRYGTWVVTENK